MQLLTAKTASILTEKLMESLNTEKCLCGCTPYLRDWVNGGFVYFLCANCGRAGEIMKTPRGASSKWSKKIVETRNFYLPLHKRV